MVIENSIEEKIKIVIFSVAEVETSKQIAITLCMVVNQEHSVNSLISFLSSSLSPVDF